MEDQPRPPGYRNRYFASEFALRFFIDNKIQRGTAHSEYSQYWRDNSKRLPQIALRLSAGMLPVEFFSNVNDPVFLHDARIQSVETKNDELVVKLHGDDDGRLRVIIIRYDCNGLNIPDIPNQLLLNNSDCDLMCHEFNAQPDLLLHHLMFANGIKLTIRCRNLIANLTPDRDIIG